MTTYIKFAPSDSVSPPFSDIFYLDGNNYLGVAMWNFSAQRYYFTLSDSSGSVVWNGALIGSPNGYDIFLAIDVFNTSTILFRSDASNFEVSP